jgi:hypothetical protein
VATHLALFRPHPACGDPTGPTTVQRKSLLTTEHDTSSNASRSSWLARPPCSRRRQYPHRNAPRQYRVGLVAAAPGFTHTQPRPHATPTPAPDGQRPNLAGDAARREPLCDLCLAAALLGSLACLWLPSGEQAFSDIGLFGFATSPITVCPGVVASLSQRRVCKWRYIGVPGSSRFAQVRPASCACVLAQGPRGPLSSSVMAPNGLSGQLGRRASP